MVFYAKAFNELSALELYNILQARSQVFMLEQNIRCQDMDGIDLAAKHYFLEEDRKLKAYLRAFYEDDSKETVRIGRVLTIDRGIGLGATVVNSALADIKQNMRCRQVFVDSQKHAIGFYEKMGFQIVSPEFLEEGIVHVRMQRDI